MQPFLCLALYRQEGQLLGTYADGDYTDYYYLGREMVARYSDSTQSDAPGYTGHVEDDLGLVYMQQRYYDANIGRFYSNDPVSYRDVHSFNRYAYANNNPYVYTDPTGMLSCGATEKDCVENVFIESNKDGSVTVSRTDIRTKGSASTASPSGAIQLQPQASLNGEPAKITPTMQDKLLDLSENTGSTIQVTSGVRTPEQNAAIGGSRAAYI